MLDLRIEFKEKVEVDESILKTILEFTKEPDRRAILSDSNGKNISWTSFETRTLKDYDRSLADKIKIYEL